MGCVARSCQARRGRPPSRPLARELAALRRLVPRPSSAAGLTSGIMERAMSPRISIDRDAISAFCRRHHIARLALFGSVLRDDFRADSDVDVLVEFQPGHVPGLDFITIERELSQLLQGRRVDMVTPKFLNARIRDQVLTSAEPLMSPRDLVYLGHMLDMARR